MRHAHSVGIVSAGAAAELEKERLAACAAAEQQRFDAIIAAQRDRAATAIASSIANVDSVRTAAVLDAEQRFDLEQQRLAAERERAIAEKQALEATKAAEFEKLRADCRKERGKQLDFQATVIKARQFADAMGQNKPKKRVNFIDNRPRSPAQPEWEPLLQGFKDMMAEALQPLQRALRSQGQGNAPSSTASTTPQSRPATPQLNPPPRGAWQNQPQRTSQGPRPGNASQRSGQPRT